MSNQQQILTSGTPRHHLTAAAVPFHHQPVHAQEVFGGRYHSPSVNSTHRSNSTAYLYQQPVSGPPLTADVRRKIEEISRETGMRFVPHQPSGAMMQTHNGNDGRIAALAQSLGPIDVPNNNPNNQNPQHIYQP